VHVTIPLHTVSTTTYLDHFHGGSAFTSTITAHGSTPAKIVYGILAGATTKTVYGPSAGVTTVAGHSVETVIKTIVHSTVTVTAFKDPRKGGSAFTTTIPAQGSHAATVIHGVLEAYKTVTSFLEPHTGVSAFSSTIHPSGTKEGTIMYGIPEHGVTTTVYGSAPGRTYLPPHGSTPGKVIITAIEPHTTTTTFLGTKTKGFTSTLTPPKSSETATVIIGYSQKYSTTTLFSSSHILTYTISAAGTTPGLIEVFTLYKLITTSTLCASTGRTFTTTVNPNEHSPTATVLIGYPETYTKTTRYGGASVSIFVQHCPSPGVEGTVVVVKPHSTVTRTTFLSLGATPFTTTYSAPSSNPTATALDGLTQKYVVTTTYGSFQAGIRTVLPNGGTPGTIIFSVPYKTVTKTTFEATKGTPFSSTFPAEPHNPTGTVLVGYVEKFTSSTIYGASRNGVSTISPIGTTPGTIIYSIAYTTVSSTTFLSSGAQPYTRTVSVSHVDHTATIIYGDPQSYVFSTVYGAASSGTRTYPPVGTTPGTTVYSHPYTTQVTTKYLSSGSPYTSTIPSSGSHNPTIVYGSEEHTTTITMYLPSGSGFSSTTSAVGSILGTVIHGIPEHETSTTTYLTKGSAYTSTARSTPPGPSETIIVGRPVVTISSTTYIHAGPAYTSTTLGGATETIIYGSSIGTLTETAYLSVGARASTSTQSALGSNSGTVIYYYPKSTVTISTCGAAATTISIAQSGSVPATAKTVFPTPV